MEDADGIPGVDERRGQALARLGLRLLAARRFRAPAGCRPQAPPCRADGGGGNPWACKGPTASKRRRQIEGIAAPTCGSALVCDTASVISREKWPAPYMPLVAVVLIVGNLIQGEVRRAVILAVFSVIVITIGTLIGNAVAARRG